MLAVEDGVLNGLDNSGALAITGGTVNGTIFAGDGSDAADLAGKGTIVISGGSFENAVEEEWCAEGFGPNKEAVDGYYSVHQHSYDAGVVTTAPTCSKPGVKTFTCGTCGDTYTEEIAATNNHTGKTTLVGRVEADCENPGYTGDYVCECGVTVETGTVIAAKGHTKDTYPEEENVILPTCSKTGSYEKVFYCSAEGCEYEFSRETVITDATGVHTYGNDPVWSWADDYSTAAATFTCTVTTCGHEQIEDATVSSEPGENEIIYTATVTFEEKDYTDSKTVSTACDHSYDAVVTAPTCTTGGFTTYTCSKCGNSYVDDETSSTGHNYVDDKCTVCGEKDPDASEPEETTVVITNKAEGVAEITAPEGGWKLGEENIFTVACSKTVVAAYTLDGGNTYYRLSAAQTGSGQSFSVDLTEGMELLVAIKGDMDGNGKIRIADVIALAQAEASGEYSSYAKLVGDMDENNKIRIADVIALAQLEAQG